VTIHARARLRVGVPCESESIRPGLGRASKHHGLRARLVRQIDSQRWRRRVHAAQRAVVVDDLREQRQSTGPAERPPRVPESVVRRRGPIWRGHEEQRARCAVHTREVRRVHGPDQAPLGGPRVAHRPCRGGREQHQQGERRCEAEEQPLHAAAARGAGSHDQFCGVRCVERGTGDSDRRRSTPSCDAANRACASVSRSSCFPKSLS
jgi:hypothetical protein